MTYSQKLQNPLWQKRRLEILERDNFTCGICGDTETELHVHHLKYTGEPHEAPDEDLQTLCRICHYIMTYPYKGQEISHAHKFIYDDGLNMIAVHLKSGTITLFRFRDNLNHSINPVITFTKDCPVLAHINNTFSNIKNPANNG